LLFHLFSKFTLRTKLIMKLFAKKQKQFSQKSSFCEDGFYIVALQLIRRYGDP